MTWKEGHSFQLVKVSTDFLIRDAWIPLTTDFNCNTKVLHTTPLLNKSNHSNLRNMIIHTVFT